MDLQDEEVSRVRPVNEDMAMQRRVWSFERWSWGVLVVLLVLAALGLFGDGPFSQRTLQSSDGALQIDYQRFSRSGSVTEMRIQVRGPHHAHATLLLEGQFFETATIENFQPQPVRAMSEGRGLLYQLATDGEGVARLTMLVRNDQVGGHRGEARVGRTSTVSFEQFVYP